MEKINIGKSKKINKSQITNTNKINIEEYEKMDLDDAENEGNIENEQSIKKKEFNNKNEGSSEKIQTESLNEKYGFKKSINIYNDMTFKKTKKKIRSKIYWIF